MISRLTLKRTPEHLNVSVLNFLRTALDDMTTRFSWSPSPASEGVTLYRLEKSLDKGLTFDALTTVANSTSSPDYDPDTNQFFYEDGSPEPGEIVRIRAENAFAYGEWGLVFCAPERPATCTLYGNILDSSGQPSSNTQVIFRIVRAPEVVDGQIPAVSSSGNLFSLNSIITKVTDKDGAVQIRMLQGSIAKLEIPELRSSTVFRVPEVDLLNLVDVPQYEIPGFQAHPGRH